MTNLYVGLPSFDPDEDGTLFNLSSDTPAVFAGSKAEMREFMRELMTKNFELQNSLAKIEREKHDKEIADHVSKYPYFCPKCYNDLPTLSDCPHCEYKISMPTEIGEIVVDQLYDEYGPVRILERDGYEREIIYELKTIGWESTTTTRLEGKQTSLPLWRPIRRPISIRLQDPNDETVSTWFFPEDDI